MPTPQADLLFVEQASCLFLKMVKNVRFNSFYGRAGCPPHKKLTLCGTGILPVLENGKKCQI
ncbi:hypothetical protein QUB70_16720 [Microcoleus sp. A003_D6]